MEATHIRFALELRNDFGIRDLEKYLCGAVYPDSRYFSGIDRRRTHPKDFLTSFRMSDDFAKGWYSHLMCDQVQFDVTQERIPSAFEGVLAQGSDVWVNISALKILQELDDVSHFDVCAYAPLLTYITNPNGEDVEKVREYYGFIRNFYVKPDILTVDSYDAVWKSFNLKEVIRKKINKKSYEYGKNQAFVKIVESIYAETIIRSRALVTR